MLNKEKKVYKKEVLPQKKKPNRCNMTIKNCNQNGYKRQIKEDIGKMKSIFKRTKNIELIQVFNIIKKKQFKKIN